MPNSPVLVKSLSDAAEYLARWNPPTNAADWHRRRPEVDRSFRQALGLKLFPPRTPLNARLVARHEFDQYLVDNVVFESRPGFPVTANLYRPTSNSGGKRAAVVSPIGHFLSAGKTATDVQARCISLAKLGFIVLAYDAIGQGERMSPGNIHHDAGYTLLPLGETIAGWMVWDSMRAIDFLMTLDDVDPQRLGITGNSGGGLNTLFTGALDERLQAAVVVGFTFEFRNWLKYGGAHCTCTHLPGIFQEMQWCEIAGLTAPRKLMMLQGANDNIFPISGARHSGAQVENVYNLLEAQGNARFVEMPGLPHAYSRPYREQMYGWMVAHLKGQAYVSPLAEPEVQPLPEKDPRLLCDPDRKFVGNAPTVVELARRQALETVEGLPGLREPQVRESIKNWARTLTAPPEVQLHSLSGRTHRKEALGDGVLELFSFNSEDGQSIPGLAWYPTNQSKPSRLVLIADARGKAAVAESGFVKPLVASGRAVIALDLRGRGETLDQYGPNYDVNFRLVANQVLFGRPLAGRRAFDLQRAMDYLGTRREFTIEDLTVVGVGDDALSALLASVVDPRVRRLVMASYVHSFISQMRARNPPAMENMGDAWNDPQLNGHIRTGDADLDFGAVIPSVLQLADVPELTALLAPRQLLVCQMRDLTAPDAETLTHRFRQLAVTGINSTQYLPTQPLEARLLLKWLDSNERP